MGIHDHEFDKLLDNYKRLRSGMLANAQVMAVNFFKASFRNQGFTDNTLEPWKKRLEGTPKDSGRAIGVNRGIMRRGVIKKSRSGTKAVVGVDPAIKYAEIQNSGGKIPITNKMRRYFWAMYYQHANAITYSTSTKEMAKTKRNENLNKTAQFWRSLALTSKLFIEIPKRQFIGDSKTLERQLTAFFEQELTKIFTQ